MEGNVQKMREALVSISSIDTRRLKSLLYELVENDIFDGGLINKITANVNKAKAALSDPPRNCDVGTAEEQFKRFQDFCAAYWHTDLPGCIGCPFENTPQDKCCSFAWAQMPYDSKKGVGE